MLMNALRLLMFSLLLIAFLPLVLLGTLGFMMFNGATPGHVRDRRGGPEGVVRLAPTVAE
jgi:hypothetical protein